MTTRPAIQERPGLFRMVVGPPRPRHEAILGATAGVLVLALLVGYIYRAGGWQGWSVLQTVVLAVMLVDLVFGIFTISAATASRWYHRPGDDARRFRLGFVLVHLLLYLVPAAALLDTGWAWALANAALLVGAAVAIEFAPADIKRLVARGLTLSAVLVNVIWLSQPVAVTLVAALLFIKILVCFLTPEDTVSRAA